MYGEQRCTLSCRSKPLVLIQQSERNQQFLRAVDTAFRRRSQPFQLCGIRPPAGKFQHRPAEVTTADLRLPPGKKTQLLLQTPQPQRLSRRTASGTSGTLTRGIQCDTRRLQCRYPHSRRKIHPPLPTAVNDNGDAFDSQTAFSYVGRQHDFAPAVRKRKQNAALSGKRH